MTGDQTPLFLSFLAEQVREEPVRALYPVDLSELGAADPAVEDADEDLPARERIGERDLVHDERLSLGNEDRGPCRLGSL